MTAKAAITGSGNIGTDLMFKIIRLSTELEMGVFVGIDPESDELARARRMGITTTAEGVGGQEDIIADVALDLVRESAAPNQNATV